MKSRKLGEFRIVSLAVTLSRTPARIAAALPELGERTAEGLEEPGYRETEMQALSRQKVV